CTKACENGDQYQDDQAFDPEHLSQLLSKTVRRRIYRRIHPILAGLAGKFRMTVVRIGDFHFRPSLWPTCIVVLLLPFLLSLGFWQLDRAGQKREWLASLEAAAEREAIDLNVAVPDDVDALHRHVLAQGRYDSAHQLLLE